MTGFDDPDDPHKHARNTDPWTSHSAAEPSKGKRTDLLLVWGVYKQNYPLGLADFEVEAILGGPANGQWRKRRSDLVNLHWLVDTGRTKINPASGKQQVVWAIAVKETVPVPKPDARPMQQSLFDFDH